MHVRDSLTLNISSNIIHDLFIFIYKISLFCKPFDDVLTNVSAAVLKKII